MEQPTPANLTNMNLATTPHHSFESADAMYVQATTIRQCAKDLQTKIDNLYSQADALESTGRDLQMQGMQQRQEIAALMDFITEQHESTLATYTGAKLAEFEKLALAVEEGRALIEQVEVLEDQLQNYERNSEQESPNINSPEEDVIGDESEQLNIELAYHVDAESIADGSDDRAYDTAADDAGGTKSEHVIVHDLECTDQEDKLEPNFESERGTISGQETVELIDIDSTNVLEDGSFLFTPEAIRVAREVVELNDSEPVDSDAVTEKRKLDDVAGSEQAGDEGSDEVLTGRQKKQRKNHDRRKKQMLTSMGYDSEDISEIDLRNIITPQKTRARKGKRSVKHLKRNTVVAKEAHGIDEVHEEGF